MRLIWIDLEMTGLKPDSDHIIEIATIVTDRHLNTLAEGPVLAIHQSDAVLDAMDDWNRRQHGASGLAARVRASTVTAAQAERADARLPGALDRAGRFADVRQQHLPGPPLPRARDAGAGALLPLPQPRREHAQGAGAALGAGGFQRLPEELHAPGARRYPRLDPRDAALPARPSCAHREAVFRGLRAQSRADPPGIAPVVHAARHCAGNRRGDGPALRCTSPGIFRICNGSRRTARKISPASDCG